MDLFYTSTSITNAEWPDIKQVVSPCPTLKVIGAITQGMVKREELKRIREMGRPGIEQGQKLKVTKIKKAVMVTDRVASFTLKNTVGRIARFLGRRLLGRVPQEALTGSFHEKEEMTTTVNTNHDENTLSNLKNNQELLEQELLSSQTTTPVVDTEDEALFEEIYDKNIMGPNVGNMTSTERNIATTV